MVRILTRFAGAMLGLSLSCAPSAPGTTGTRDASNLATVSQVDLRRAALTPGIAEYNFALPDAPERARSATVWLPSTGTPRTLILFLHGAVVRVGPGRAWGPREQARLLLECLAVPAFADLDPLVLAPHSTTGQWWTEDETADVLTLFEAARQRWPEAARRAVIAGYSNGGIGAWYFARLFPRYFNAAIPLATNATIIGATSIPVYAIHGTKDELFHISGVRAATAKLASQGYDVTLHEKYRATHMKPCDYVAELSAAARWLEQHALSPRQARGPVSIHEKP